MSEELFDDLPPVPKRRGRPRGRHYKGPKETRVPNVARQPGTPLGAVEIQVMKRRIVDGLVHKTLDRILRENSDIPGRRAIARWMIGDTGFARECIIARQEYAQGLLEMAQERLGDALKEKPIDRNMIYGLQVFVNHIQWYVSKVLAQIYGDKLEIDHKVERVILAPNPKVALQLAQQAPTIEGLIEAQTILPGTAFPAMEER